MENTIESNDHIYVYWGAIPAFTYYKTIETIQTDNMTFYGTAHKYNMSGYDEELLTISGKTWIVFSHILPNDENEKYIIEFLLKNGSKIITSEKFVGSSIYYVDAKQEVISSNSNMLK